MESPCLKPSLSDAGLDPTHGVEAYDEFGELRPLRVAGESPLTIKVDDREIVTLMTLGTDPELLTLGYLRNQRLIEDLQAIASIEVDWERERVDVRTRSGREITDWEAKLARRTVTTGCGQGTVFSCTLDKLYAVRLPQVHLRQSMLYDLLRAVGARNEIYREAGAVHGCGLCRQEQVLTFIEDVGRHNACDAISGHMWMHDIDGGDKILYTTGRLTSEIVMKAATMGIPVLVSRNGITRMGLELGQELGVTLIARAKGKQFLAYTGGERIEYDRMPRRHTQHLVTPTGKRRVAV